LNQNNSGAGRETEAEECKMSVTKTSVEVITWKI